MNPDARAEREVPSWSPFQERYRNGEWRAPIFRDMVLADLRQLATSREVTLLDIGCGKGFDDEPKFQTAFAGVCRRYLGVEPDENISPNPVIEHVYHCLFEQAPLEPSSVDLAYSVMVLEHLETPQAFWDKLHDTLSDGGIFWGFTIDSRNPFSKLSVLSKHIRIKDWYLNRLHGKKGEDRYENYPVFYRSNRPDQLERLTSRFRSLTILNFHQIGQLDYYLPGSLRWIGRLMDRRIRRRGLPGSIMAIRAVK